MPAATLYKYLDFDGGLLMLKYRTLQFTNATKFNDPFDCHPDLFDFSNAPKNARNWPPADFVSQMEYTRLKNYREQTWICCLSKVYDSLLMWAYYNNHKGICIGLDIAAVLKSCQERFAGLSAPHKAYEVKYRDINNKPDYFRDRPLPSDMLLTKAKVWEHEQEMRLIAENPYWANAARDVPQEFYEEETIDGKEIRHYPRLSADCFTSVYLGVNMLPRKKEQIVETAKKLNPNISVYQIILDPKAFKLIAQPVE